MSKKIHHDHFDFMLDVQRLFNICKPLYTISHIWAQTQKSHDLLRKERRSLFKKNATFLYDKILNENRESKKLTLT